MPLEGTYVPSPWEPIATQVAEYEATGGVEGGELEGAPCVILTTVGNRSGNLRKTPLVRVEHDGDEKTTWWARATEVWPAYDDYQASTDRRIPLVLLEER